MISLLFSPTRITGENHFFGSVARLAAEQGIPVWAPEDVNHPLWIERIREMKPDVLFSSTIATCWAMRSSIWRRKGRSTCTVRCCQNIAAARR